MFLKLSSPSISILPGAWMIHVVLIFSGKILVDIIPGITQDVSWTTVNICYDVVSKKNRLYPDSQQLIALSLF
jgi:hypothetical protein